MLTVDEATRKILPFARVMKGAERLPLREAAGRILTHDVFASRDVPPHDNSAMDGYALNTADLGNSSLLPIAATVYAGDVPEALQPGTVMRIFTGSPVPEGADAVLSAVVAIAKRMSRIPARLMVL
jgi:molybdopterin molybdotransferase